MATMNHYGNNHMLALEPRFMYDGALAADAAAALVATEGADDGGETQPESIHYDDSDALLTLLQSEGYVPPAAGRATELLFLAHEEIDSPETFLGQLPGDMAVVGLDSDASNGSGLDAITGALSQYTNIEAIHIVSHGQSGAFSLGDMQLTADNLLPDGTQYDTQLATQLATWSEHLTEDADILIYGCDVARGDAGQGFIEGIADLTGADVAASSDATGAASEGGDWALEYSAGSVETDSAFDAEAMADYGHLLGESAVTALTSSEGSVTFTEGDSPIAVDDGLVVTVDRISGATVTITDATEDDSLAFTDNDSDDSIALSGAYSYDSGVGTLTLTGNGTVAEYEAALQVVEYDYLNSSATDTVTRSVDFGWTWIGGNPDSATGTDNVSTTQDADPVVVGPSLTITDTSPLTYSGATITIAGIFADDVLSFTDNSGSDGIGESGTYTSGTLTLTGDGSATEYQAALRAILFSNASQSPDTATRQITFTLTEAGGESATITRDFAVVSVNDAPSGTDNTVLAYKNESYVFTVEDFGFTDTDSNDLLAVEITTPAALDGTWAGPAGAITSDQTVSVTKAEIEAGQLTFDPATDEIGADYATFTFEVQDDGGTADSGVDTAVASNTMTIDVMATKPVYSVADTAAKLGGTVSVDASASLTSSFEGYDGGSITFDLTDGETGNENLLLPTVDSLGALNTAEGKVSVFGSDVYIGKSGEAVKIGTIDTTNDGQGTNPLTITFVDPTTNNVDILADFEDNITATENTTVTVDGESISYEEGDILPTTGTADDTLGWMVSRERYGTDNTLGTDIPTDINYSFQGAFTYLASDPKVESGQKSTGDSLVEGDMATKSGYILPGEVLLYDIDSLGLKDVPDMNFTVDIAGAQASSGENSLQLYTKAGLINSQKTDTLLAGTKAEYDAFVGEPKNNAFNRSVHGPSLVSDPFSLVSGDEIQISIGSLIGSDGDAFELFVYLIEDDGGVYDATDAHHLLLGFRGDGTDTKNTMSWTKDYSIPTGGRSGDFRLKIVTGSYDATGGGALGSTIYLDDVKRVSTGAVDYTYEIGDAEVSAVIQALSYENTAVCDDLSTAESAGTELADRTLLTTIEFDESLGANRFEIESTISLEGPHLPQGVDKAVEVDAGETYRFSASDFGISDLDGDALENIEIVTLPSFVTLELGGRSVTVGDSIAVGDLGKMSFTLDESADGSPYDQFTFKVRDSGSFECASLAESANVFRINANPVADELPSPIVKPPPVLSPVIPDVSPQRTLDVGPSNPMRSNPAPEPVSQPMSLGELSAPVGDIGGREAPGIAMDQYQTDSGTTLKLPPSLGKGLGEVADPQVNVADDGLLPEGSVKFNPGNQFQKPSIEIANTDSDASGTTEVTVAGVDADGNMVQQSFKVTVENGVVQLVEPVEGSSPAKGASSPEPSNATPAANAADAITAPRGGTLAESGAEGANLDLNRMDGGTSSKLPASVGRSFEGATNIETSSANETLIPKGSVRLTEGSGPGQKAALEITGLDSDASGTTQVTVEAVDANGDTVQQTFEVTVEDGVVTKVKPLQGKGRIDRMDGEAVGEDGAGGGKSAALKGNTTVEKGDGGDKGGKKGAGADTDEGAAEEVPAGEIAPEGESGLPGGVIPLDGGVIPQEGAFLWPSMESLPLSGQLQQAAGGAFLARQASLLRAASAYARA